MSFTYAYPRPAVTVDAAVFKETGSGIEILLIQRGNEPFKDGWALPGGFMDMEETLEEAIHREMAEETGLKGLKLQQLQAFSTLGRDPRGRTITIVFYGILQDEQQATAGDDASDAKWFSIDSLPELAFDHDEVIAIAISRINRET